MLHIALRAAALALVIGVGGGIVSAGGKPARRSRRGRRCRGG